MLERNEPAGRPIALRDAVCREFKIDYKPYTLKKRQKEALYEERYVKRAFERLFKNGFAVPVWALRDGFSLIPSGCGGDFDYCILTEKGRLAAEQLKRQEQSLRDWETIVKPVLVQLRGLGHVYVTLLQVREVLWENVWQEFVSREEFDRYWNDKRLGDVLKSYRVGRARVNRKGGKRKYCLTSVSVTDDAKV